MPKPRSSSSRKHSRQKDVTRKRCRPNPGPSNRIRPGLHQGSSNHVNRGKERTAAFDALRKEISETLCLPSDCRIYFLKKYEKTNLPNKPRLKITHQNAVLLDAETWKVLQVVRFTPFLDMSEEKMKETNFIVKTIYNHTLARGRVEVNASMEGLVDAGEMYSAGFRGGSDKGRTIGVTAISAKTAKSKKLIMEDQERMLELARVNEILAESMSTLFMRAFQSNRDLALRFSIPSFSDPTWAESPNANVIASNIICTRDGFFNNSHKDNDATPYSYGIFAKINRTSGELHWDAISDYLGDIVGCNFVLDEYHVEVALDSCDGLVESYWAAHEFHHTTASTTYDEGWISIHPRDSPITRFGSSLQISQVLVKRIDGLLKLKEGKSEDEWEIYKKQVVKCYNQEIESKLEKLEK